MMATSPVPSSGYHDFRDIGLAPVAVDRSVRHHRCDYAGQAQLDAPRGGFAVAVREAPATTTFAVGPVLRVLLVAAQASATKRGLSGSRSIGSSNQCWHFLRTSGRPGSIAWPVFTGWPAFFPTSYMMLALEAYRRIGQSQKQSE